VLHASPEQRYEAFILLDEPRALTAIKQLVGAPEELDEGMPTTGDLWRALRLRRGLEARQVARHLGVSASTVSRWEASLEMVPRERCDELLDLLGAHPDERFVLRGQRVILMPPLQERLRSVTECRDCLMDLQEAIERREVPLGDLQFRTLEAILWPLACGDPSALETYLFALVNHAQYLLWEGRVPEMYAVCRRAFPIARRATPGQWIHGHLAEQYAFYLMQRPGKKEPMEAVRILQEMMPVAETHRQEAGFYRDMADYMIYARRFEDAQELIKRSRRCAERHNGLDALRMADIVEARVLVRSKRPAEALKLLVEDNEEAPNLRVFELLLRAEACLDLDETHDAYFWLDRFYAHIEAHGIEYQRVQGDRLSTRLADR
jgi:transcriptional regulator with XRE-family HTH domain